MKSDHTIPLIVLVGVAILFAGTCNPLSFTACNIERPALIARRDPKPVVAPSARCLIFGFDSCPACKTLHRTTREMSRNGWRVGDKPTDDIEHIDIHGRDERIAKYKHSSYPTLIIVDKSGREVARHVGAMGAEELATFIRKYRA